MSQSNSLRSIDTLLLPTQQSALLLQQAALYGVEAYKLLHGTGLSPADLEDDDRWISYRQTMQIVDNAYRLTGRPTLGLDVGSSENIGTFGILGYAMLSCATVGEALTVGEKYQRAAQNLCDVQLDDLDDKVSVSAATPFVLSPERYRFAIEELFSGVMKIIQLLTGEIVFPEEIHCAYKRPDYAREYEQVFRCPVYYDQPKNRMLLSRKLFDLPVPQANKFNARMSEKLCQEILRKYIGEEDLSTRIRHIILRVPGEFPDEATVAKALALSGRTLRRQLGKLDTSYRELLDQVRSDLAQQYLSNSSLSVEQVALLLGYTETTNFRRAFKRWLGISPKDYRKGLSIHKL